MTATAFVRPLARTSAMSGRAANPSMTARVGRRHEQVDVPDRLAHAPKRTGEGGLGDGGKRAKLVHQLLGDLEGHTELHAGAGLLGLGDGPAQVLLAGGAPAARARAVAPDGAQRSEELGQ